MFRPQVSVISAASLLLTLVGMLSAAPAAAKPTAVLVEPIKDFEVVAKGEHIKHAFEIRNEGTSTLTIKEVRPACGCTVTRFDKTIAPGSSGFVYADVDTISFDGVIAKTIAVFTDDTDNERLQLVVKADVRPYIAVEPGYARFSYVQGEPVGVIGQTIWAPDGGDIEIVEIKSPYDHLKIRQREATTAERKGEKAGKQWRLDIELAPDAPVGALRDHVEVRLDHPKQKKVLVAISGFVRPRQHVTPDQLDFGQLNQTDLPREYTLTFTNFATAGIQVESVETGVEGVEVEIKPADSTGHRFQMFLRLDPSLPKGKFDGALKIHHTDTIAPVYEIPLSGVVL